MRFDRAITGESSEDLIDAIEERIAIMIEGSRDDFASEEDLKDTAAKPHGFADWMDFEDWKSGVLEDQALATIGL